MGEVNQMSLALCEWSGFACYWCIINRLKMCRKHHTLFSLFLIFILVVNFRC